LTSGRSEKGRRTSTQPRSARSPTTFDFQGQQYDTEFKLNYNYLDTDGKLREIASSGQHTFGYDDAFRITGVTDVADSTKSLDLGLRQP
jgi:YD repeat-containing protein